MKSPLQVRSCGQELRNHQLWQKSGSKRLALIQDSPPLIPDIRLKGQTSKGIWPDTRLPPTKGWDTSNKFLLEGGEAIETLLGRKNLFYFYFHKSHLFLYLFVAVFVGKYFQFWQKRLLRLLGSPPLVHLFKIIITVAILTLASWLSLPSFLHFKVF